MGVIGRRTGERAALGVVASATGRRWHDRLNADGRAVALAIAERHGLAEIVARVMAARGVGLEDAESFLDPSLRRLMPDPSSLAGMDVAAVRLADAVERREVVALIGDYDVDGATSVALVARVLGRLGIRPRIHIPDRLVDGYGPNVAAIRRLAADGATLLVTLDCGSASHGPIAEAVRLGLDVVVIDHHPAAEALPAALAIVNPNRQDDLSGQGHLAAVGVAFLVMAALLRELRRRGRSVNVDLLSLLDLAALGTVCDVVPLAGLNRAFVAKGLVALRGRVNPGLAALAASARLGGPASVHHLGYLLGPRINAGGRIGDSTLGVRLLLADDPAEAEAIAAELEQLNRERQVVEEAMVAEAAAMADAMPETPVTVVAGDTWHAGVVGLVAARLKERLRRPAIAVAFQAADGTVAEAGAGSGRSIPGVDLGAAIRAAAEEGLLVRGGGHAMAAGMMVARARLDDLRAFLAERLAANVEMARAEPQLGIDGVVAAAAATPDLVVALDRVGPFGAGHAEPVLALPSHRISWAEATPQGHVRAGLAGPDGATIKAIAFRAADEPLGRALLGARGRMLHVAGCLGLDHWQGVARTQLRVLDVADPAAARLSAVPPTPYVPSPLIAS